MTATASIVTQDDAAALASEWRQSMSAEVRSVSESTTKLAQTVAVLEGRVSNHDATLKEIRQAPDAFRQWATFAMTAIGSGCGCVVLVSSLMGMASVVLTAVLLFTHA